MGAELSIAHQVAAWRGSSRMHRNLESYSQIEPEVTCHIRQPDDPLHQLVREYFTTENFDVKSSTPSGKSAAICRAENIMDTTTTRVGERFETGLL